LRRVLLSIALPWLALVSSPGWAAETLIDENFSTDPSARSWTNYNPSANNDPNLTNTWNAVGSYDGGSITVRADFWHSRTFAPAAGTYIYTSLVGKTSAVATFGTLTENTYRTNATGQWTTYETVSRNIAPTSNVAIFYGTPGAGFEIDNVVVKALNSAETATAMDSMWSRMPAHAITPATDRTRNLTNTFNRLKTGQTLKIVLLGDSIVSDTLRSPFETLVERMYPGADITTIESTRGSTGCWYYKDPAILQQYVLQYNPDLVMIGGISHQNDEASLRSVVSQIQAWGTSNSQNVDVLLTSEMAAGFDPNTNSAGLVAPDPASTTDWRNNLIAVSNDLGTGYWDMTQPWEQYILASGLPYDSYKRDGTHMNAQGSMLAGRILESYFTPVPEPVAIAPLAIAGAMFLRRRRAASLNS
jgi:hypothetical protein